MKIAIKNQTLTHQDATTDEIRSGSGPEVRDFFEVRHQLMLENREIDSIREEPVGRVNHNSRLAFSLISGERVETALYWLISAPALFYLAYLVIRSLTGVMP